MDVEDEVGRHTIGSAGKSRTRDTEIVPITISTLHKQGESKLHRKQAIKGQHRMMVLWQERPQRERVLEETSRFGQGRIKPRRRR